MSSPIIRPQDRTADRARRARRLAVLDALSTERAMGAGLNRQRARREMAIRCRSLLP
ncbi:MAG: hypothetical protein ACT4P1_07195 [Sporichthyaceae bacterium]